MNNNNDQDAMGGFFQLSYTQPCDVRAADTVRYIHRLQNQDHNIFKAPNGKYYDHARPRISRTARVIDKNSLTSKEDTGSLMIT